MGRYAQASAMDDLPPNTLNVSGEASATGQTALPVDTGVTSDEITQQAKTVVTPTTTTTPLNGGRRRRRRRSTKKGRSRNGGTFVTEIATPLALLGATQYMKNRNARKSLKRRRSRKSYKNKSQKRRRRY